MQARILHGDAIDMLRTASQAQGKESKGQAVNAIEELEKFKRMHPSLGPLTSEEKMWATVAGLLAGSLIILLIHFLA